MTIHAVTVTVDCDRCAESTTLEIPRLEESTLDRALRELNWQQRPDGTDACPRHPRSLRLSEVS